MTSSTYWNNVNVETNNININNMQTIKDLNENN